MAYASNGNKCFKTKQVFERPGLKAKHGPYPSILGLFEPFKRFSEVGFNFPDDKDIPNFGAKTKFNLIIAVSYIPVTFVADL